MTAEKPLQIANMGEMLVSFTRVDFGRSAALDDEGCLTRSFLTLELGAKEQDGEELVITPEMLDEIVGNFEWRSSRGYKTPVVVGHPGVGEPTPAKAWEKRIEAPAVGWVLGATVKGDGLHVTVKFNSSFSRQLLDGGYEFNSPSFSTKWTDEFGKSRGAVLVDVGILNYPLQEGMGSIMAASARGRGATNMDPEVKALLDDLVARIEALEGASGGGEELSGRMEALENAMSEMTEASSPAEHAEEGEPVAMPVEDLEQARTSYAALADQVKSLGAKVNDEIATLRDQLNRSTEVTERMTAEAHAADCLRFLSAQVDSGKLAPADLPDKWESNPAEAFDALGFKSLAAAETRFASIPENAVVDLSGSPMSRTGATDRPASLVTDDAWNLSSMRPRLIDRFDGDEAKAREHYETLLAGTTPNPVESD